MMERSVSTQSDRVRELLARARSDERSGSIVEALEGYERTVEAADRAGDMEALAEALRRQGVARHVRGEIERARELCERSYAVAMAIGLNVAAGEALNALAGFDIERGEHQAARQGFERALTLGGVDAGLRARAHQNLGILANIHGDLGEAIACYQLSLGAFQSAGDERGCALAYNNLGMASADGLAWDAAQRYFDAALDIADRLGDVPLRGLCLLNSTEVHLAAGAHARARATAEEALAIFEGLGDAASCASAQRFLGMIDRESGDERAESRLRTAVGLARRAAVPLEEAESLRELARLHQARRSGREALECLGAARRLFGSLDARRDAVDVGAKIAELEETWLAVVRDWGREIESADTYTHGHCERVASYSTAVAGALGLDVQARTTVRVGAYLHDIGKVRVPGELLNKAGRLTDEEFGVLKMHPQWGTEMIAGVEFPWDIVPIIRWHHEKHDGSGYPDRLAGDRIPVTAQIICIADVYDALTTQRSYKPALAPEVALAEMHAVRHWWRGDVYEAFRESVGR
jgi:putative nucleotidyltransferase with HDIG domain